MKDPTPKSQKSTIVENESIQYPYRFHTVFDHTCYLELLDYLSKYAKVDLDHSDEEHKILCAAARLARNIPTDDPDFDFDMDAIIRSGNLSIIKFLIEEKSFHFDTMESGKQFQPLFKAARFNQIDVVKYFMEQLEINMDMYFAALKAAVKGGYLDTAKCLVEAINIKIGAINDTGKANDVNLILKNDHFNFKKEQLLTAAARNGHLEMVKFLLAAKSFYDYENMESLRMYEALQAAVESGSLPVAQHFIEQCRLSINYKYEGEVTLLHEAAFRGRIDIINYLVKEQGADLKSKDALGRTPLLQAVSNPIIEPITIDTLLELGADILDKDSEGSDFLYYVVENGELDYIAKLLNQKVFQFDLRNHKNNFGDTLLHGAMKGDNLKVVKYLIEEKNLDVHKANDYGHTLLHIAAINKELETVKYLVNEQGADLHAKCSQGRTPIYWAAMREFISTHHAYHGIWLDCLSVVKFLLEKGADIDIEDNDENNLLHAAAAGGDLELIMFLVKHKNFDPDAENFYGHTPLFTLLCGSLDSERLNDAVRYFVEDLRLDIDKKNKKNATILHAAVLFGELKIVEYLVKERQADINAKDEAGRTALLLAAANNATHIAQFLLQCGADVYAQDNAKNNFLYYALESGNLEVISSLIEAQMFKADMENDIGSTVLFAAVNGGNLQVLKYLVEVLKIDIQKPNDYGYTVLYEATYVGNLRMVEYLLEQGATVDNKCRNECTALFCAADVGSLEIIRVLLAHGAKLDVKDNQHNTLLHYAAGSGHIEVMEFLINEHKFDVLSENLLNLTPLFFAARRGKLESVKYFLEQRNMSVDRRNALNQTVLFEAIREGHIHIVRYLVDKQKADVDVVDIDGITPLEFAEEKYENDIAEYLRSCGAVETKVK